MYSRGSGIKLVTIVFLGRGQVDLSLAHISNYLSINARFPQDKEAVLTTLDQASAEDINLKPEWMRGL